MKIGDKVRFLNEVGGGTVSGFQDKQMVLVQDEDGFDIPMLISDCVVVEPDDYNIAKVKTITPAPPQKRSEPETDEPAPLSKPYAYTTTVAERQGGNELNIYLAFVPVESEQEGEPEYETYLINDSNYHVTFAYLSAEGSNWQIRFNGTAEPNMKLMLERFSRPQVQQLERVSVQLFAYKLGRPFALKPAMNVELRIDGTKFFKPGAFAPSDFFEEPALLVEVVRHDEPVRSVFVNASQLQQVLMEKKVGDTRPARVPKKPALHPGQPLEVDLHAGQLFDTTEGLEAKDILEAQMRKFGEIMDRHIKQKGFKIVFIHGKGNGVLRQEIIKTLKYKYKSCLYQDASFREYGFGATLVTIK